MTREEYLKELNKAFGDFKFFADDHHYEYKEIKVGMSVTRLIEEYANEFNQEEVAEKVALKNKKNYDYAKNQLDYYYPDTIESYEELQEMLNLPITIQQVLDEWKYKNEFATTKGSSVHEYIQSLFSGKPYTPVYYDDSDKYLNALEKCEEQAKWFWREHRDALEHVADEYVIGSAEYDIASCVDHLFINNLTGGLVMIDYKTNKDIYKNDKYADKMKPPLHHLKDTTLNHYALQLSIYKYIIEKYTDLVVEEWFIVWFSEENDNYKILEVPYLKKEVEEILEWRKWD